MALNFADGGKAHFFNTSTFNLCSKIPGGGLPPWTAQGGMRTIAPPKCVRYCCITSPAPAPHSQDVIYENDL